MKHSGKTAHAVCRYLVEQGPTTADTIGAFLWHDRKRGRVSAPQGGGDYAAQMLLGRLKTAGLVQHTHSWRGSSTMWEVTAAGREFAKRDLG